MCISFVGRSQGAEEVSYTNRMGTSYAEQFRSMKDVFRMSHIGIASLLFPERKTTSSFFFEFISFNRSADKSWIRKTENKGHFYLANT